MSTFHAIALGFACFALGFTICSWIWARRWYRSVKANCERIEADAQRIGREIEAAQKSIRAGARRTSDRFRL